jgi:EmrB/QacA subfamily drug resistance transporter
MVFIDGTIVNVALPALQKELNATVVDVQWIVESYALLLAALLLVGGSAGDRFGRRFIYTIGILVFALASAWCGLSTGVTQLIVARAVQGAGGALLVPGSLAIISASFSEERRGRAIGTWSGFTAITAAIGPVVGGWLIENVSWRAAFFINLPIAVGVLMLVFWRVPESRDETEHRTIDWQGAALATIGLGSLVYSLIESSRLGFKSPVVLLTLALGLSSLAGFVVVESRSRDPMLPLSLFRSRTFSGANLLTLLLYAALSGALFFLPLNLIQVQGYSATAAGAALLPFVLIMFVLSRWSGGLVERYGAKLPLTIGPVIAAAGFLLFNVVDVGSSYFSFFPAVIVLGLGMAIAVAPLTTSVMNSVSQSQAGVASGINNAVSRTAGVLALAVFPVIFLHNFNQQLDRALPGIEMSSEARRLLDNERIKLAAMERPPDLTPQSRELLDRAIAESFVSSYRLIMMIAAGLAIASAFAAWWLIEGKKAGGGQGRRNAGKREAATG